MVMHTGCAKLPAGVTSTSNVCWAQFRGSKKLVGGELNRMGPHDVYRSHSTPAKLIMAMGDLVEGGLLHVSLKLVRLADNAEVKVCGHSHGHADTWHHCQLTSPEVSFGCRLLLTCRRITMMSHQHLMQLQIAHHQCCQGRKPGYQVSFCARGWAMTRKQ